MKKIFLATIAFSFVLLVGGCEKDGNGNDSDCPFSEENLRGNYKIVAAVYKAGATDPEEDDFATWDACEKDDIYTFAEAGVLTQTDAGTECTPSGTATSSYTISGNTVTIAGTTSYTVVSFGCSGFVVSEDGLSAGEEYKITFAKL
jgi:hypothetical protein